jgi:hypothetical protein
MCNANVKMDNYYVNICKHEHEKNMKRLWCKIVFKTGVEQTKKMKQPMNSMRSGHWFACVSLIEVFHIFHNIC